MLKFHILTDDGAAAHVGCAGSLSRQPLADAADALERLLGPSVFARRVHLDLEHVDFLDSTGIGWLVECHKRFRQQGGALCLCALPPRILQMLQFCRLDRYFHLNRPAWPAPPPDCAEAA